MQYFSSFHFVAFVFEKFAKTWSMENILYLDSLRTDQSFRGSTHMLKMIEGIRASEVTFFLFSILHYSAS